MLFLNLDHLDLVIGKVPLAFCELVASALARRDEDGPRLRKLRVGVHEFPSARQPPYLWPNYRQTGIFDHVDSADVSYLDDDADAQGVGMGEVEGLCAARWA